MKPEEMRDDIPMDVREALAAVKGSVRDDWFVRLFETIRPKPRIVRLPAAELPAPLEEVPESGDVWVVEPAAAFRVVRLIGADACRAVERGFAWHTREDAEAWLAHLQSWKRPGTDWTPHTPGDPMPCDGEALVDVRFRDGYVSRSDHADHYGWKRLDEDRPHDCEITAWRYAREDEA